MICTPQTPRTSQGGQNPGQPVETHKPLTDAPALLLPEQRWREVPRSVPGCVGHDWALPLSGRPVCCPPRGVCLLGVDAPAPSHRRLGPFRSERGVRRSDGSARRQARRVRTCTAPQAPRRPRAQEGPERWSTASLVAPVWAALFNFDKQAHSCTSLAGRGAEGRRCSTQPSTCLGRGVHDRQRRTRFARAYPQLQRCPESGGTGLCLRIVCHACPIRTCLTPLLRAPLSVLARSPMGRWGRRWGGGGWE